MAIEIRIVCDGCKAVNARYGWGWKKDGAKPHLIRKALREKLAWQTGLPRGQDLCYHCSMERRKEVP